MGERLTDRQIDRLLEVVDPEVNPTRKSERIADAIGRMVLDNFPIEVVNYADVSNNVAFAAGMTIGLKAAQGDIKAIKAIAAIGNVSDLELGRMLSDEAHRLVSNPNQGSLPEGTMYYGLGTAGEVGVDPLGR